MTSKEVMKVIYDYFSFLEEGGGPAMSGEIMHSWLEDLLDKYLKSKSDNVVNQIIEKFEERSGLGIKKYGTTLSENKGPKEYWLNHLQEELMDATLYIQKLKTLYDDKKKDN